MGRCPSPLSHGACHTLVSFGCFPLSKHTGEGGDTPSFSGRLVYLEFVRGNAPPSLQWSFPHDSNCYKLSLLLVCWAGVAIPALSGQLVYLQFQWRSALSPLSRAQGAPPSLLPVFFFQLLVFYFISFLFFLFSFVPGWGSVCPGGYADLSQGIPCAAYFLTLWSPN
jgi:hypothetical protein